MGSAGQLQALLNSFCDQLYSVGLCRVQDTCTGAACSMQPALMPGVQQTQEAEADVAASGALDHLAQAAHMHLWHSRIVIFFCTPATGQANPRLAHSSARVCLAQWPWTVLLHPWHWAHGPSSGKKYGPGLCSRLPHTVLLQA